MAPAFTPLRRLRRAGGALVVALAVTWATHAPAVTLAWDASTGAAVARYRLHVGLASGVYDYSIDAGPDTQCPLPPLAAGRAHYFAVTAHDATGGRSEYSNEVVLAREQVDALPLAAGFAAAPIIGVAPLTVRFTPFATGAMGSYRWNLGDGAEVVAEARMPLPDVVHTYTRAGTFAVTFTIDGPTGEASRQRTAAIRVLASGDEPAPGGGSAFEPRLEVVERSCVPRRSR